MLFVFDTLLTLPSEIKHVWCVKPKLGSSLYVLVRYPALVLFNLEIYVSVVHESPQVWSGATVYDIFSLTCTSSMSFELPFTNLGDSH